MVRFAFWKELKDYHNWETTDKTHVGILVEHDAIMKTAKILYKGEVVNIRSQFVEKAGKKDYHKKSKTK